MKRFLGILILLACILLAMPVCAEGGWVSESDMMPAYVGGDNEAEHMKSSTIQFCYPPDRSGVLCGKNSLLLFEYELLTDGERPKLEIIDLETGAVIERKNGEAGSPSYYILISSAASFTPGRAYLAKMTRGDEVVCSRFIVLDEATFDGEDPWALLGDAYADKLPTQSAAAEPPSVSSDETNQVDASSAPASSESAADPKAVPYELGDDVLYIESLNNTMVPYGFVLAEMDGLAPEPLSSFDNGLMRQLRYPSNVDKNLVRPCIYYDETVTLTMEQWAPTAKNAELQGRSFLRYLQALSADWPEGKGAAAPLNMKQLEKLFLKKGNEIPWVFYPGATLVGGAKHGCWQVIPFGVRDGGKGSHNNELYLYAFTSASITKVFGEREVNDIGLHCLIITDPDEVAAILASAYSPLCNDRSYAQVADVMEWYYNYVEEAAK